MKKLIMAAATLLCCNSIVAAQTSIADAFARMQGQNVTGVTVITHGFTLNDSGGGYMLPLAQAIRSKIAAQTGQPVWLLDYDLAADGATGGFGSGSVLPAAGSTQPGHVVLLYDWGPESNEDSQWWAESAGDALFALGTGLGLFDPRRQTSPPTQFIAHSFGTVTTSEAVERLAAYRVPVDQVTLIDPHDFDQANVPTYDEAQRMHELGAPAGYGATIWNNVRDADVYYQTRGNQDPIVGLGTADPEGRPIPGAYNRLLDGASELPGGNPYSLFSLASDHGYTWNTFYMSTVNGSLVSGAYPPAQAGFDYTQTGWAHSVHNANRVPLPATSFYAANQSHEHSSTQLVTGGAPNTVGLAQLGLTSEQVTNARFTPQYQVGDVANGNLSSGNRTSASVDVVAGWTHHGGGGDSEILTEGTNRYLQLDSNDPARTHNYTYVPANAYELVFDARVFDSSSDDTARVVVGGQTLTTLSLASTTGWTTHHVPLPSALRDQVDTFGFSLAFGSNTFDSPEIDFDNIRFAIATPVVTSNVAVGNIVDLGELYLGETRTLSDALTISNTGHGESVLDLIRSTIAGSVSDVGLWSFSGLTDMQSLRVTDAATSFDLAFAGTTFAGSYAAVLTLATNLGPLSWTLSAEVINRYAGDFNSDGNVDTADYTVWRDNLGSTTSLTADANRNGVIDTGDYDIWRTQFGWHAPPLADISIPEPATLLLLVACAGLYAFCASLRRMQRQVI